MSVADVLIALAFLATVALDAWLICRIRKPPCD